MLRLKPVPRFACIATFFFLLSPIPVLAMECYQCHGVTNPPDYRPVDSPYRNISSGGFQGNHRTHMVPAAGASSCSKCHQETAEYGPGHRNSLIEISLNINNSPLTAVYRNGSTAFPQRTTPRLGSCSNVNCHFERETPTWGGPAFTVPDSCAQCHGSPPGGGDSGAAGSHAKHDLYYSGTAGCAKCHTDHRTDSPPFGHATSAGRNLILAVQNPFSSANGSYSGALDDYLPKSQTNQFGNCSNVYCHSKGDSKSTFVSNIVPVWGTPLPPDCTGCHGNGHGTATEITSGSHTMHTGRDYYGQYVYPCGTCHYTTATGNITVVNPANHVNTKIDVALSPIFGGSYTVSGHDPGGTVGQCANVYCHSDVQPDGGIGGPTSYDNPTWGAANSIGCGGCHATGGHGHGSTSQMATGSHIKHLSYSFTTTTNTVKCMICHKYTDYPFVTSCFGNPYGNIICHASGTSVKHANGKIDVRLDPTFGNMSAYLGSPEPGNGYANCTNTYCHSNGTSISTGTIPSSATTNWGSGAVACSSCHGYPPGYGTGSSKANSHIQHSGAGCNRCHFGTTTSGSAISSITLHVNKAYDVTAGSGVTFAYSYAAPGGVCSNISCHGGRNATWGTTLPCDECHDAPPDTVAHRKHFSGTVVQAAYGDVRIAQDFTPDATGYIMNCGNCHPIDRARHGNGVIDVELYNSQSAAGSLKAMNPATAAYTNGTSSHTDSRGFAYTNGTCSNIYCHSYNSFTTPTDCTFTNESGSRYCDGYAQANLQVTRVYRDVTWNSSLPDGCSGCHANAPRTDYTTNDGMTGDSHAWGNPWDYEQGHFNKEWFNMNPITCNYCHNDTVKADSKWWRSNPPFYTNFSSVPIAGFSKHVNGKKDVAFEKTKPFTMERADWWGNITRTDFSLTGATYDKETKSCNSVSCHLGQTTVKWGKTYRGYQAWNGIDYVCWECHSGGY
ncbi:MAG: Cytochrome [Geobacteraceae bacterium]|nr:MAG: Cytochrome [Geobacteraceae bacterium]